jgi:hypothetical protein
MYGSAVRKALEGVLLSQATEHIRYAVVCKEKQHCYSYCGWVSARKSSTLCSEYWTDILHISLQHDSSYWTRSCTKTVTFPWIRHPKTDTTVRTNILSSFYLILYRHFIQFSLLAWCRTRVEAGSNTSTVNLRVVRGDEMGLKKAAP